VKHPGLLKRLAVVVYDGLLLAGIILVTYALLFAVLQLTPEGFTESSVAKAIRAFFLVAVSFVFYGWFWTHGGQTLGMKVWHLYLLNQEGKFISWPRAGLRYICAVFSWGAIAAVLYLLEIERWYMTLGLGFVWIIASKNNHAWHDFMSNTKIVYKKN
jgi:uncharacterized RDD family membrane protein YckC